MEPWNWSPSARMIVLSGLNGYHVLCRLIIVTEKAIFGPDLKAGIKV